MQWLIKKKIFKNGDWDWILFLTIFIHQSIPSIYNSYSTYLIGNSTPDENSLSVVSQWQFIQLIVEIFQESIVLPIFFLVGSKLKSGDSELINKRVVSSIWIVLLALTPLILILCFQAKNFVDFINTPKEIISLTIVYLKIKVCSLFFSIANLALITIIESLRNKCLLIKLLILKMFLVIIIDSLFFGGYDYSLGLGIKGVAWSGLAVEGLMFFAIITHLQYNMNFDIFSSPFCITKKEIKLFGTISSGIVVESSVKNIAYFTMIIALINSLGVKQIGGYYLSIHLFWSLLLVPVISLSDTLKILIANNFKDKQKVKNLLKFGADISIAFMLL